MKHQNTSLQVPAPIYENSVRKGKELVAKKARSRADPRPLCRTRL